MFLVGDTRLFFSPSGLRFREKYEKERVSLNHMAFGVRTLNELQTIERKLNRARISHSGIKIDQYGQKEFIWLDDPDGMRIEFYLRPDESPG